MKIVALIVAAGRGQRFDSPTPKQYCLLNNEAILFKTIKCFLKHKLIDDVLVVINSNDIIRYCTLIGKLKLLPYIIGSDTRQQSVHTGLKALENYNPDYVLIHDAARPFVSQNLISNVINSLAKFDAVDVGIDLIDTVRHKSFVKPINRDELYLSQTPQGFKYKKILQLHQSNIDKNYTDDISMFTNNNLNVNVIKGDKSNFKITYKQDLILAEKMNYNYSYRVGNGFDVHQLEKHPDSLIPICGVLVPCSFRVIAHSDGDVGIHALMDAILGALSLGDIGMHFSPKESSWKNADSKDLLKRIYVLIKEKKAAIENIDITLICQEPMINPYKQSMIQCLANILDLNINQVSIKATTTERLGFVGRQEGIIAQATCLLKIDNGEKFCDS